MEIWEGFQPSSPLTRLKNFQNALQTSREIFLDKVKTVWSDCNWCGNSCREETFNDAELLVWEFSAVSSCHKCTSTSWSCKGDFFAVCSCNTRSGWFQGGAMQDFLYMEIVKSLSCTLSTELLSLLIQQHFSHRRLSSLQFFFLRFLKHV